MVGARSGWGSVWLLLLRGSVGLLWVVFLEGEGEQKRPLVGGQGGGGTTSVFRVSGQTSKAGQFMCIPGPWLLLNHFRSSCVFAARTVRSSSLYIVA